MKKRMTRILVSTLLAATVCTPLVTTNTVMAESGAKYHSGKCKWKENFI